MFKQLIKGMLFLVLAVPANAQVNLGTINGTIYDKIDSTTTMPFSRVWIETESGPRNVITDENGRYKIDALKPGVYNLHARPVGYLEMTITEIEVTANTITKVNGYCSNVLPIIEVFVPLIVPGDIPKLEIPIEDIETSLNIRDPKALLTGLSSEIQMTEGTDQVIIRGSRPGDAIYYIDGVKSTDMAMVPGVAIGGLDAFLGGVPAKYGDTTGGVIVLETKGYFDLYNRWKYKQ